MPKESKSEFVKLKKLVREFGEAFCINTDPILKKQILFCQSCNCEVNCGQKSQVKQHIKTQNHRNSIKNFKSKQRSVAECFNLSQNEFNSDLCKFMVSNNIPFNKLSYESFKGLFEKYTKFTVPDESNLRKSHLKNLYETVIQEIRSELKDQFIWLSIDETTDRFGNYVTSVIVGSLNANQEKNKIFLLNMEYIPKTNHLNIIQSITNALMLLWPEGIQYGKVLLLVTDVANYMKLLGKN